VHRVAAFGAPAADHASAEQHNPVTHAGEATGRRVGSADGSETVLSARYDGTVLQQWTYRFEHRKVSVF
jgi:hypothetical protein